MYATGYVVGYVIACLILAAPPIALVGWAFRKRPYIMYRNAPRKVRRSWDRMTAIDPIGPLKWNPDYGRFE